MQYVIDIPRWINIRELAANLGVSHMAVYRARNGVGSEEMIKRIKDAVEHEKAAKSTENEKIPEPAAA